MALFNPEDTPKKQLEKELAVEFGIPREALQTRPDVSDIMPMGAVAGLWSRIPTILKWGIPLAVVGSTFKNMRDINENKGTNITPKQALEIAGSVIKQPSTDTTGKKALGMFMEGVSNILAKNVDHLTPKSLNTFLEFVITMAKPFMSEFAKDAFVSPLDFAKIMQAQSSVYRNLNAPTLDQNWLSKYMLLQSQLGGTKPSAINPYMLSGEDTDVF